jgi:hypothetical protein
VTASAATAPSSAAASPATALAGERQICGANRNPERADTCGKPQHDKPADKSFADPAHDVIPSPKRPFLWRTANAILMRAFRSLRNCDAALHRGNEIGGRSISPDRYATGYGGNQIAGCGSNHDHVR